jgi:hypothetical protein
MLISMFAGFDPYASAGALAKVDMALRANISETFLAARIREQGEKEMNHDRWSAARLAGSGSHAESKASQFQCVI